MKTAIVIPARYASTRLPGKPLLQETGTLLIQHVYEQAQRCQRADAVIVATDDSRIRDAVTSFGGRAVMTREDHPSGTDRIAEVAMQLDHDVIVNLQGDEPQFDPAGLDQLIGLLAGAPQANSATLATPIRDVAQYQSPNAVKVVRDDTGRALYFSRSPIPCYRDGLPENLSEPWALLHLGVYAYRRDFLLRLAKTPPHPLEQAEKLEQLRVLGLGEMMLVGIVPVAHKGIDTPEDYAGFLTSIRPG